MKMNKKIFKMVLFSVIVGFTSCEDYLDKQPLSTPTTASFLTNETEVNVALTGVYQSIYWNTSSLPYQYVFDFWTDIALERSPGNAAGTFDVYNSHAQNVWDYAYTTIQRANTMLDGMEQARDNIDQETFERMQAEARLLRVWSYYYLTFMYGDVPLITAPMEPEEYKVSRTPKEEVINFMYSEIDDIYEKLPWWSDDRGRLNRGVAMGLKARIALQAGDYKMAEESSKLVMDGEAYGLNPNYGDLFTRSGQITNANHEIMFELIYADAAANPRTFVPLGQGSRNLGGQSGKFPTQRLVDNFEASDGKRIDNSEVYDPEYPNKHRDLRLKYTVGIDGDTITQYGGGNQPKTAIFDVYDETTQFFNYGTGEWYNGTNIDYSNPYSPINSGVGLMWTKYTFNDEDLFNAKVSWIFMRYAETLLTFAEAKIEQNEIDENVINTLNLLRERAKLPDLSAKQTSSQDEMRKVVRRERTSELALEGFRWFDIRRWDIAKIVMPGHVYGASLDPDNPAPIPSFSSSAVNNTNNIPEYSGTEDLRFTRDDRAYTPKLDLLPIPQRERDINENLTQNPGW